MSAISTDALRRLTVAQYDAMGRAGILTPDDRVELLEGLLVEKMTKNPPHRIATNRTRAALSAVLVAGWYVDTQEPIVTADSEPEPDVVIVKGRTEDYRGSNPPASSVALVIEIADTTLARDRETKARIYARAGIATYWIINLVDSIVEVYTQPIGTEATARYARRDDHARGAQLAHAVLSGAVRVDDLLP
jgi:Uma2 family endonuclease